MPEQNENAAVATPVFHVFPSPVTMSGEVNSRLLNHNVLIVVNPKMSLALCQMIENYEIDKSDPEERTLWAFRNALRGHFHDRNARPAKADAA